MTNQTALIAFPKIGEGGPLAVDEDDTANPPCFYLVRISCHARSPSLRQYRQGEVLIAFAPLYLKLTKNIIIQAIPMVNIIIGMPYASDFFTQPQRILLGVIGRRYAF